MANLTFASYKTELLLRLGNREDVDALVGGWVNTAMMDLLTRNKFWGLKVPIDLMFPEFDAVDASQATSNGIPYISYPANALYIKHIWNSTSDRKLDKITPREYVENTGRTTSASYSLPAKWTRGVDGNKIHLYPTPDDTYALSIYYRRRPAIMSDDADTTEIGEEWDEVILKLATAQSLMRLKDFQNAAIWQQGFMADLADKMNFVLKEAVDSKHWVRPDYIYILKDTYGR